METSAAAYEQTEEMNVQQEFVRTAIRAWYERNDHVRCPFPPEIREQLEKNSWNTFRQWLISMEDSEANRMSMNEVAELFESILFHEATQLVTTPDEQITILFPFLPRTGDIVRDEVRGEGVVVSRKLEHEKDKKNRLSLTVQSVNDDNTWQTSFELPV